MLSYSLPILDRQERAGERPVIHIRCLTRRSGHLIIVSWADQLGVSIDGYSRLGGAVSMIGVSILSGVFHDLKIYTERQALVGRVLGGHAGGRNAEDGRGF